MKLKKRLRKMVKYGPWGYRFWRELMRRPYERAFPTPAVAEDLLAAFPAAAELRANFDAFRAEALAVATGRDLPANHEIMPEQTTFYEHDRIPWKMVALRAYSYDYRANLAQMPLMADFLRRNPRVVSATVSVFPGGKHLRPHRGPWKGVWRYHLAYLGEDLGEGRTSAELQIDGNTHYLRTGDDLLWDDTYMHAAINRAETPRIVLLLDVLREHPWWLGWISGTVLHVARIAQGVRGMDRRAAVAR